jgi:adenylosuccinate synthase
VLRQLPTAALLADTLCVLGPGSYIDVDILLREVALTGLPPERLIIDERAFVITPEDVAAEAASEITSSIGSTGSGTGAALRRRIDRRGKEGTAKTATELRPFLADTNVLLRTLLSHGRRVVVEGTQGFGLSVLHSPFYPFATSRDTSAAGALSEAGLSPLDVDEVVLVLRSLPIRVGGNSGPLPGETTWETVSAESETSIPFEEFTSVTRKLRRVARFDSDVVRRAIVVNQPTMVVLNHVDQIDARCGEAGALTDRARAFVAATAQAIGREVSLVGVGPSTLVQMGPKAVRAAS